MTLARGEIWFAPGIRMVDVDFGNFDSLVDAFARRIHGFFLNPVKFLRRMDPPDAGLFVAALACATTIRVRRNG